MKARFARLCISIYLHIIDFNIPTGIDFVNPQFDAPTRSNLVADGERSFVIVPSFGVPRHVQRIPELLAYVTIWACSAIKNNAGAICTCACNSSQQCVSETEFSIDGELFTRNEAPRIQHLTETAPRMIPIIQAKGMATTTCTRRDHLYLRTIPVSVSPVQILLLHIRIFNKRLTILLKNVCFDIGSVDIPVRIRISEIKLREVGLFPVFTMDVNSMDMMPATFVGRVRSNVAHTMIFSHIIFVSVKEDVITALVRIPGVNQTIDTCFDFSREGNSVAGIDTVGVEDLGLSPTVVNAG
mmetsp:Transcript_16680/g.28355  ORF Transcript_16680/g.28355 Transcript_16680/m.28355 type:complete len:298 (+) Transcript_16680:157-1050(+)